jgi:Holliday junction resolvase RusA-like endonuclease
METEYVTDTERKQDAAAFHDALKDLAPKVIRLTLKGPVPCKKNLWKRGPHGQYIDKAVKAQIDALIIQAKQQWRRIPLTDPDMDVEFFVLDRRSDRDNKLGCILDVLQSAGVLKNDNVANFNGTLVIHPAVVGTQEGVIIDVSERQQVIE